MSVIAMTMDDQRPLVNTYDKMQDQQKYEQNVHNNANAPMGSVEISSNAPPSGPASPTPSGSEEPMSQQYHHNISQYHQQQQHHNHHHHHHHAKAQQSPYVLQQPHHLHHHRLQQLQSPQCAADNGNVIIEQKPQQQQHESPLNVAKTSSSSSHQLLKKVELNQTTSLTCAVTVKAESVVEENHGQQLLEETILSLKEEQSRLLQQCTDAQRREKILMRRLANKEQEFQDYVSQISEYKAAQAPSAMALRSALLDPAVNLLFVKLKKELKTTKAKLEETQNELSAWKFTPDSNTGKRLMAKCRLLYQENEELGKMTSNGRLAKLESELSMQKSFSKLLIKSQSELDEFLHELDEDVEGMQSTILLLQQELKTKNDLIQTLEKDNELLRQNNQHAKIHESKSETLKSDTLDLDTEILNGVKTTITITPKIEIEDEDVESTNVSVNYSKNNESSDLDTKDLNKCADDSVITYNNAINDLSSLSSRHDANEVNVVNSNKVETADNAAPYFNGIAAENMITANSTSEEMIAQHTINPRKRPHDEINPINDNKVQVIQQQTQLAYIATQRMLPPKKSKLRVTPEELVEQQDGFVNMPVAEEALSLVMEKDPLASTNNDILSAGCEDLSDGGSGGIVGIGLAAQRILTRRRSIRQQTQPNGSINMTMVGGANGNDSNEAATSLN